MTDAFFKSSEFRTNNVTSRERGLRQPYSYLVAIHDCLLAQFEILESLSLKQKH